MFQDDSRGGRGRQNPRSGFCRRLPREYAGDLFVGKRYAGGRGDRPSERDRLQGKRNFLSRSAGTGVGTDPVNRLPEYLSVPFFPVPFAAFGAVVAQVASAASFAARRTASASFPFVPSVDRPERVDECRRDDDCRDDSLHVVIFLQPDAAYLIDEERQQPC